MTRHVRSHCHRALVTVLAILVLSVPRPVASQGAPDAGSRSIDPTAEEDAYRPSLSGRTELSLFGLGAGLVLTTRALPERVRPIPQPGFDPLGIAWSVDRNALGQPSEAADRLSDLTRDASVLLPLALALVTTSGPGRWDDLTVSGVTYSEALLLSGALTHVGKVAFGRARPSAYLSVEDEQRVASAGAFHSMPSSHSAMAWTGAALVVTHHLLLRPQAGALERLGVGFVSGALASATSALRVEAGAHFPSDVIVGAGIGAASGISVPLLHRGDRSLPSRGAWLEMLGGVALGTVFGVAATGR